MPDATKSPSRFRAILALLLLVPAPSLGVMVGMVWWPGDWGTAFFMGTKVWMFLLPTVWWLWIERGRISRSPLLKGGLGLGTLTGVVISLIIFGGYWLLKDLLLKPDAIANMRDAAEANGLANKTKYLIGCLFWITINSLLEEYVYRWFVVRKVQEAAGDAEGRTPSVAWLAIIVSALAFTIHHVVAMRVQGLAWPVTILANVGVFIGGATWSWLYHRYQSIWPGYVSHAIIDIPIFVIGWWLIFG